MAVYETRVFWQLNTTYGEFRPGTVKRYNFPLSVFYAESEYVTNKPVKIPTYKIWYYY